MLPLASFGSAEPDVAGVRNLLVLSRARGFGGAEDGAGEAQPTCLGGDAGVRCSGMRWPTGFLPGRRQIEASLISRTFVGRRCCLCAPRPHRR